MIQQSEEPERWKVSNRTWRWRWRWTAGCRCSGCSSSKKDLLKHVTVPIEWEASKWENVWNWWVPCSLQAVRLEVTPQCLGSSSAWVMLIPRDLKIDLQTIYTYIPFVVIMSGLARLQPNWRQHQCLPSLSPLSLVIPAHIEALLSTE